MSGRPTDAEQLIALLGFMADPAEATIRQIKAYHDSCAAGTVDRAHIWDPFVEIAEGIFKVPTSIEDSTVPSAARDLWEELKQAVEAIFERPNGCVVTDDDLLNSPDWESVRTTAGQCLAKFDLQEPSRLSVLELLWYFGD